MNYQSDNNNFISQDLTNDNKNTMIIQSASQQHQQQIHQQHLQQNQIPTNTHLQQRLISNQIRGARATQQTPELQQQIHSVGGASGYILATPQHQTHYDPEAALVETIVTHLANLNDDEVFKKSLKV